VALACTKSCHVDSGVSQEPSCVSAVYQPQMCGCERLSEERHDTAVNQKLLHGCEHCVRQFQQCAPFSPPHTTVVFSPYARGNTFFRLGVQLSVRVHECPTLRQQWCHRKFLLLSGRTGTCLGWSSDGLIYMPLSFILLRGSVFSAASYRRIHHGICSLTS